MSMVHFQKLKITYKVIFTVFSAFKNHKMNYQRNLIQRMHYNIINPHKYFYVNKILYTWLK